MDFQVENTILAEFLLASRSVVLNIFRLGASLRKCLFLDYGKRLQQLFCCKDLHIDQSRWECFWHYWFLFEVFGFTLWIIWRYLHTQQYCTSPLKASHGILVENCWPRFKKFWKNVIVPIFYDCSVANTGNKMLLVIYLIYILCFLVLMALSGFTMSKPAM